MTPRLSKFTLTAHVSSSVGWLGAVAAFLALSIAGLTSENTQMVRATYLAMELVGWCVIVPLSLASLLTGLGQSLGTTWGLFRHYWIVVKLLIAVIATVFLLLHMQPVGHLANVVAKTTLARGELAGLRIQLVADAGAAILVLLVATALSIYKPQGLTPYGRRKQSENSNTGWQPGRETSTPHWVKVVGVIVILSVLIFLVLHLTGHGPGRHR